MKIGIIGAGQIGGTLTRRLTQLGHEVSVANSRGPESLADLARETGAKAVTAREGARAGEVVVVRFPWRKSGTCPGTCLPASRRAWLSWTRQITIRNSAMAALKRSKMECWRAAGSKNSLGGLW